jgi:hypothetical protein
MSLQASFTLRGRNPDVLTCIANLSNDEVFTPPDLANRMLDTLTEAWAKNHGGANLWADKSVTFLDPCTKSGVFLRETTRRLTEGLAGEIPDLQKRVNHILTKQVFGIGITRIHAYSIADKAHVGSRANGASHDSPGQRPGFPAHPPIQALKGRHIRCADWPALSGLAWVFTTQPRALPWAGMERPCGAEAPYSKDPSIDPGGRNRCLDPPSTKSSRRSRSCARASNH